MTITSSLRFLYIFGGSSLLCATAILESVFFCNKIIIPLKICQMTESKFSTLRFHKLFLRSFFLLALHICFRAKTKSYTILKLHYILFFWPFENSRDFFEDLMKPQIIEIILQSEYLFQILIDFYFFYRTCICQFGQPSW